MCSRNIRKSIFITLYSLFIFSFLSVSHASDTAREKRWADEIVDSIMVGDAVWLKAKKQKFLGIYTENTTAKAQGGAIIVHGTGVHPNWSDVVHPLRSQLPDYGWHTLSIQMPILSNDAPYKDYPPLYSELTPRFDAAINFLKKKGIQNIVIISHSQGATMSAYYLANKAKHGIQAFVAIGMRGKFEDDRMNALLAIKKITIPIFDLYGEQDLKYVLSSSKNKLRAARKAGHKNFTQLEVAGANHFFVGKEDILVKRVRGWLLKNANGTEIKIK